MRTQNYPSTGSSHAERAAKFREQMADFARGERMRALREARHLSQEDAAHEIGVSVKSVRAWEKGGGIRWDNAKHAGEFYAVDPETLVTREADREQPSSELGGDLVGELDGSVSARLTRIEQGVEKLLALVGPIAAAQVVDDAAQAIPESRSQAARAPASSGSKRPAAKRRAGSQ